MAQRILYFSPLIIAFFLIARWLLCPAISLNIAVFLGACGLDLTKLDLSPSARWSSKPYFPRHQTSLPRQGLFIPYLGKTLSIPYFIKALSIPYLSKDQLRLPREKRWRISGQRREDVSHFQLFYFLFHRYCRTKVSIDVQCGNFKLLIHLYCQT